jgi:hypothetical protein
MVKGRERRFNECGPGMQLEETKEAYQPFFHIQTCVLGLNGGRIGDRERGMHGC